MSQGVYEGSSDAFTIAFLSITLILIVNRQTRSYNIRGVACNVPVRPTNYLRPISANAFCTTFKVMHSAL